MWFVTCNKYSTMLHTTTCITRCSVVCVLVRGAVSLVMCVAVIVCHSKIGKADSRSAVNPLGMVVTMHGVHINPGFNQ